MAPALLLLRAVESLYNIRLLLFGHVAMPLGTIPHVRDARGEGATLGKKKVTAHPLSEGHDPSVQVIPSFQMIGLFYISFSLRDPRFKTGRMLMV
jgi:hypothetical protein